MKFTIYRIMYENTVYKITCDLIKSNNCKFILLIEYIFDEHILITTYTFSGNYIKACGRFS